MKKILFICHGNICRSPMAESILTHLVRERGVENQFEISSAAVSAEELGNDVYPPAKAELRRRGIPLVPHRAWQVSRADYDRYDVFVAMDRSNVSYLTMRFGGDREHKIRLLMHYTDRGGEVSDPWYTDRFDIAFNDIYKGCEALLNSALAGEL